MQRGIGVCSVTSSLFLHEQLPLWGLWGCWHLHASRSFRRMFVYISEKVDSVTNHSLKILK